MHVHVQRGRPRGAPAGGRDRVRAGRRRHERERRLRRYACGRRHRELCRPDVGSGGGRGAGGARQASQTRFRGIRHASGWHASDAVRNSHTQPLEGLLLDTGFRQGFACLEKRDLVFDAWLYHTQLLDLVDLARAFEGTTIILDHVGGPLGIGPHAGQRAEVFEVWKAGIDALSQYSNVVVKLGGMTMPICGFDFHKRDMPPGSLELADALGPYYLFCIERFGPQRCMFESNFPVDKASCSYGVLWNAFKRISAGFST